MGNNNNDYWNTSAVKILSEKALKNTTYYGVIPNAEINNYLKKAHVVLFPSFGENFSIGLLEVMALGKLIVASNIPAFQEIIVNRVNGFVADNDMDYYLCVKDIFDDKFPVKEISNAAVETIKNEFALNNIISQNIDYYKSIQ